MTFYSSDPDPEIAARATAARDPEADDRTGWSSQRTDVPAALDLPPLPTLRPLPALRPMAPMPRPPWDSGDDGPPAEPVATEQGPQPAPSRTASAPSGPVPAPPGLAPAPSGPASAPARPVPAPRVPRESARPIPPPPPVGHPAAAGHTGVPVPVPRPRQGRHAAVEPAERRGPVIGKRVLVIGGAEPLTGTVAERLVGAGHRLAVTEAALPTDGQRGHHRHADVMSGQRAPIVLTADRDSVDDMAGVVAGADLALDGLEALVVLPGPRPDTVRLDTSPGAWADTWAHALASGVLAVAGAAHAAARSFLADRRAGRIILVTTDGDAGSTDLPGHTVRAAVTALGDDLARELEPRGVGVSVVSTGGGAAGVAAGQVADLVETLLSTPVLSGVTVRGG